MENDNSISSQSTGGQAARIVRSAAFIITAIVIVARVLTSQNEAVASPVVVVMCVLTGLVMGLTGIMALSSKEMF